MTTLKQQSLLYSNKLMMHIHQLLAAARRLCALVKGARGGGIDMDAVQVRAQCALHLLHCRSAGSGCCMPFRPGMLCLYGRLIPLLCSLLNVRCAAGSSF